MGNRAGKVLEDVIVRRRFGSRYPDRPCADPSVLVCCLLECQTKNRCKKSKSSDEEEE
jgi:hypothetical protein